MIQQWFLPKSTRWAALCIGALTFAFLWWVIATGQPPYPEMVFVGEKAYTLQIADTDEQRALGLGERDSLCDTCAMLFVFTVSGRHAFWMEGMRFPLDIAWVARDGEVIHIEHRIAQESRSVYRPEVPVPYVLEFNAGALDTVRKGERVRFVPSLRGG